MATVVPRSEQLLAARHANVPRGVGVAHPIVVGSASGATVWDVDGRTFIDFVAGLRERADAHGFLLVADEIQSGFGRTGRMFALEHTGVEADLVTVAKSLAGGLPLAGVIGTASVMDAPDVGGLGGTYGGNPLACAAALAVLDVFEREAVLERAVALGARLRSVLEDAAARYPQIGEVRGLGPMLAIELVHDRASRRPAPELARAVLEEARDRGLLLLTAGMHGNVVRFLTPLLIDEAELGQGLIALRGALAAALVAAEDAAV